MDETALVGSILLVDDDAVIQSVFGEFLKSKGHDFLSASDGENGLRMAHRFLPDLIFLDISMPIMDGLEACRLLKADPATRRIPVVMFTASTDRASRIEALKAGADDFINKPIDGTELLVRVANLLKVKRYQDFLEEHSRILEATVAERTRQLREALLDTVQRLTLAAEFRDEDTYVHVKRISYFIEVLVKAFGIPSDEADIMFYASPMHDIGKVGIPDAILLKPAELTSGEREIIKAHTTIGARILSGSDSPYLKSAAKFALYHHERWDGTGYPSGLKGEQIPIEGRILNIIDQYDALRSRRPYKSPLDHQTTLRIIELGDGRTMPGHFDPRVLGTFMANEATIQRIYEEHLEN